MRWITTRYKNENNNEPFFIPIARTFTVDLFEDDREVLEAFFVFDDDRTTLMCVECKANMIDVCCAVFLRQENLRSSLFRCVSAWSLSFSLFDVRFNLYMHSRVSECVNEKKHAFRPKKNPLASFACTLFQTTHKKQHLSPLSLSLSQKFVGFGEKFKKSKRQKWEKTLSKLSLLSASYHQHLRPHHHHNRTLVIQKKEREKNDTITSEQEQFQQFQQLLK